MKNREIKEALISAHNQSTGRIIIVIGARQTGKTTLLKKSFSSYPVISFDDPVMRVQYATLTAGQWEQVYPKVILDEVQKLPSVMESVKAVYDNSQETRYIISGSSQLLLLKQVKESLAGRCLIRELFPLTLPEIRTKGWNDKIETSFFQKIMQGQPVNLYKHPSLLLNPEHPSMVKALSHYLTFGGYPAVSHDIPDQEKYDWLAGYVRTYLERDIRDLANFRDLEPFVRSQQITALHTGNLINYSFLAKEAGVSPATAQRFLTYLEVSYQVLQLQPWFRNKQKRLVKTPKLHYLDIGVQQAIIRKRGGLSGNEFESAIVAEIYKQAKNLSLPLQFFHIRTADGREVDLLIECEKGYYAFEIKMAKHIQASDTRHIHGLGELLDKPLLGSYILSNDPTVKEVAPGVTAVPAALFLG